MFNYINSPFAQLLSQQLPPDPNAPPQPPQFGAAPPPPPQADPSVLTPPQPDNVNDGINSVGRPADTSKSDEALKKLDRASKGQALMALGAQLLSSRTFGEGLSKGLQAYTETLRSLRPTTKPIGDGEYEEVTDPRTGQSYVRRTLIHADKVKERNKPVAAGNHLWQYGTDADGNYNGKVTDLAPPELDSISTRDAAGNPIVLLLDKSTGSVYDPKAKAAPPPPPNATIAGAPDASQAPDAGPAAPAARGGFPSAVDFVLKHEGGYSPSDWNGKPVNMGINQGANPGVDVKSLTRDGATSIYKTGYWDKSGAANLPPVMQIPYFDTFVRNPAKARAFLTQSGGDPNKFMALRKAWDQQAGARHPGDAKGLMNRDADLDAAIASGAAPPPPVGTPADAPAPDAATAPPAAPDNPWGLQPHDFSAKAPPTHFASPDELKAHGFEPKTVAQVDAKGNFHILQKGDSGSGPLDAQTEEFYAQAVAAGTPISQLIAGMGKDAAAQRQQVMRRYAKDAGADGLSGSDYSIQIAHYAAAKKNVANLETQYGTIQGNEATAIKNGQAFLDASRALPHQTGSALLNKPIQSYLRQTGDPHVAAMDIAARTFATEYAKVIQGSPNGGGTLTDSAAAEAIKVLRGDYSMQQKMAAYQQARVDMENRTSALHSNLQNAYAHMKDRAPELTGQASGGRPAPKAGTVVRGFRFNGGNPADQHNWTKI